MGIRLLTKELLLLEVSVRTTPELTAVITIASAAPTCVATLADAIELEMTLATPTVCAAEAADAEAAAVCAAAD